MDNSVLSEKVRNLVKNHVKMLFVFLNRYA